MALRDQPYIPLYIQDFLTDEKLIECSAESTGVYIRLMCIMHKSDEYGTILLRQKDKQNSNNCLNFANKLAKHCKNQIATSSTRYATVLLKNSKPPIWLTVPVGLDFSLEENDSVVINIFDCAKQIERHSK